MKTGTEKSVILPIEVSAEALAQMSNFGRLGTRWAAYQNQNLGSLLVGDLRFLAIGPEHTFQEAPERMPDSDKLGPGWAYCFVGWVDLSDGIVREGDRV